MDWMWGQISLGERDDVVDCMIESVGIRCTIWHAIYARLGGSQIASVCPNWYFTESCMTGDSAQTLE